MLKRLLGPAAPPPVFQPSWGPAMAIIWVIVIYFGCVFAVFGAESLGWIVTSLPDGKLDVAAVQRWAGPMQIACSLIVASRLRVNPFDVLALRRPVNATRLFAILLAIIVAMFVGLTVASWFTDEDDFMNDPSQQLNEEKIRSSGVVGSLLVTGLIAPINEELMFRGILLLSFFQTRLWFWGGAVISSILFAVMHNPTSGNILVHAPYFVIGLAYAAALRFTGSLWVSIGLHMAKNSLAVLLVSL